MALCISCVMLSASGSQQTHLDQPGEALPCWTCFESVKSGDFVALTKGKL